jgi:hypothetical protein
MATMNKWRCTATDAAGKSRTLSLRGPAKEEDVRRLAKLKPGESAVIRLATNAPYALANTGAVVLDYTVLQD